MFDSVKAKRLQTNFEDLRLFPYDDTKGNITIGIGHNLTAKGIPEEIADLLYEKDQNEVIMQCDTNFPWWRNLDPVRQFVVYDMVFNMGLTKFQGFKTTIKYITEGNYLKAAANMKLSLWYRQTKRRAVILVSMMESGKWPVDT